MEVIKLNRFRTSRMVWEVILENSEMSAIRDKPLLLSEGLQLDHLRDQAEYNTGSISSATCWVLFALSLLLKPKVVAEVGTFIGRSALSFVRGMERARIADGLVLTCDYSNDIKLPFPSSIRVRQFPKKSSTEMFQAMIDEQIKCDFLALDGRLQQADFGLLDAILKPESVIVLDDFEGVEKGVVNALSFVGPLRRTHNLIYPPSRDLLDRFGLLDACSTAIIIPRTLLTFSNQ